MLITTAPELRDEVKSKIAPDMGGIVIAKYPGEVPGTTFLDVRLFDEKIYYKTLIQNWEVVKLNDE